MRLSRKLSLALLLAGLAGPSSAQQGSFDGLHFREIGPATPAGRIDDLAVLESNPSVFYVATATGGVWKTVNNGTTFTTVFDDETTSSIGDVAMAPDDPNLVWVGTGENNNRQSSSWGEGVFKSTDGGQSWTHMGFAESRHIARIVIDPSDLDVVYVASLGSLWGPGGERGVYKTTDGGDTFERVLHIDDDTGATELLMDPRNPKVLYAATYQRRRSTWGFNGGGPGSAIHKTTDGGKTWTRLSEGLPEGELGRIGMDLYRKNPDVVYARIEHEDEGGVYRSDDAGASWSKLSSVNPRPMYFSQIRVDPTDDSRIYVLGTQLHISDDGGKTFRDDGALQVHVDFHAMWVNPDNPDHVLLGGDGGIGISYDRSETYVWLNNMPLGQFYHVSYDMQTPYHVCGGLQDNNTWCAPSAVRSRAGIGNDDWYIIGGGDGFVAIVDPTNPRIAYSESQNGRMRKVDRLTNERQSIQPEPEEGEDELRWNWDTPMMLSPHDPATIFVAANKVFRSEDRGHAFSAISPDLTTGVDREELQLMGVYGKDFKLAKNDGISHYPTLVSFAESELREGLYWAGSEDGRIHVSRDSGISWSDVTDAIEGLPPSSYVSEVVPSRFEEDRVYATFDGHRLNDFDAHVYVSDNRGKSFRSITSGLAAGEIARTIVEDLVNPDVLYLGTERGLYVSVDRGGAWERVKADLPTVPIYEIALHPRENDMILATHGRSIWILDDLSPFQKHAESTASDAYLFETSPGVQRTPARNRMREFEGDRHFLGENPVWGVALTYRLSEDVESAAIEIRDGSGEAVTTLDGGSSAGLHRVSWNLRWPNLPRVGEGGGSRFGDQYDSPFVFPATYRAHLLVDGDEKGNTAVEVRGDPEVDIDDAGRRLHSDTAHSAYELNRRANVAAKTMAELRDQYLAMKTAVEDDELSEEIESKVEDMTDRVDTLRRRFGVGRRERGRPPRENVRGNISRVRSSLISATAVPTEAETRRLARLEGELDGIVAELNTLINDVSGFYQELASEGVYPKTPQPVG